MNMGPPRFVFMNLNENYWFKNEMRKSASSSTKCAFTRFGAKKCALMHIFGAKTNVHLEKCTFFFAKNRQKKCILRNALFIFFNKCTFFFEKVCNDALLVVDAHFFRIKNEHSKCASS